MFGPKWASFLSGRVDTYDGSFNKYSFIPRSAEELSVQFRLEADSKIGHEIEDGLVKKVLMNYLQLHLQLYCNGFLYLPSLVVGMRKAEFEWPDEDRSQTEKKYPLPC